jgi:hypothetical protein
MGVFLVMIFRCPFFEYIFIALFSMMWYTNIVFHWLFSLFVFCCVYFLCLFVHWFVLCGIVYEYCITIGLIIIVLFWKVWGIMLVWIWANNVFALHSYENPSVHMKIDEQKSRNRLSWHNWDWRTTSHSFRSALFDNLFKTLMLGRYLGIKCRLYSLPEKTEIILLTWKSKVAPLHRQCLRLVVCVHPHHHQMSFWFR